MALVIAALIVGSSIVIGPILFSVQIATP